MRAFAFSQYKQPLNEVTIPEPEVGDNDVLIAVEASGVNHLDERIRLGEFKAFLPYPTPLVLGHEAAGTVISTGSAVTGFAAGDRVYTRPRDFRIGTFTERIAVDAADVAHAPNTLTATEAAALPLVALTAWQALVEQGQITAGDKVLIHGGSGAVGSLAIQLAKHLGAYVATTASQGNAEFLHDLGADRVIDYRTEDFAAELSEYDVVLDSLGGDNLLRSLTVLKPGGLAIGISGPPTPAFAKAQGLNPLLQLIMGALSFTVRRRAKKLGVRYFFLLMRASGEQLSTIADLVDSGALRPIVGAVYPFSETPQALESLGTSRVRGKTVIRGAGETD